MHLHDCTEPALLCPGDQGRADVYALIASLLLEPPGARLLAGLAAVRPARGLTPLECAWQDLCDAARELDAQAVAAEHAALFVAVGRASVDARAAWPGASGPPAQTLAVLRADLRGLGLARRCRASHTEEHLGALCETLALLITGAPGIARHGLAVQRRFFAAHLAPWYGACLAEIRRAAAGPFHEAVACFAQAFFDAECEAFGLARPCIPLPEPGPDARSLTAAAAARP